MATASPEPDEAPRRRQMNVRIPDDIIEAIDARRKRKGLSRDVWVERALRFALTNAPEPSTRTR